MSTFYSHLKGRGFWCNLFQSHVGVTFQDWVLGLRRLLNVYIPQNGLLSILEGTHKGPVLQKARTTSAGTLKEALTEKYPQWDGLLLTSPDKRTQGD